MIKEGWLLKADPGGSRWKNRWCVLMPSTFLYYAAADKRDTNLKGAFELAKAGLAVGSPRPVDKPYVFHIDLPGRSYYFAATSQVAMQEWVAATERTLAALQGRPVDPSLAGDEDEDAPPPHAALGDGGDADGGSADGRYGAEASTARTRTAGGMRGALASRYGASGRSGGPGGHWDGHDAHAFVAASAGGGSGAHEGGAYEDGGVADGGGGGDDMSFQVVYVDGLNASEPTKTSKTFTLRVSAAKRDTFTLAQVKKRVARNLHLDAAELRLTVEGDTTELQDDWRAAEIMVSGPVPLRVTRMHATPTLSAAPPPPAGSSTSPGGSDEWAARRHHRQLTSWDDALEPVGEEGEGEGEEEEEAAAPAATKKSPPPAPARGGVASANFTGATFLGDTAAQQLPVPAPAPASGTGMPAAPAGAEPMGERTQDRVIPPRGALLGGDGGRGAGGSPAGGELSEWTPTGDDRLDRRMKMRRLFNALAQADSMSFLSSLDAGGRVGPGALPVVGSQATVDRLELASSLAADIDIITWREYEVLVRRLASPSLPAMLTWDAFSAIYRDVQTELDRRASGASYAEAAPAPAAGHATQDAVVSTAAPRRRYAEPAHDAAPAPSTAAHHVDGDAAYGDDSAVAQPTTAWQAPPPVGSAPSDSVSPGGGNPGPGAKHVIVMAVDGPNGVTGEITVQAGDDPEAVARDFIHRHGLDEGEFLSQLVEEVRRSLLEAYQLDMRDMQAEVETARALAVAAMEAANIGGSIGGPDRPTSTPAPHSTSAPPSPAGTLAVGAPAAAPAPAHGSQVRGVNVDALLDQLRATEDARARAEAESATLAQQVVQLQAQLEAAQREADAAKAAAAANAEAAELGRRQQAWSRYVEGGDANIAAATTLTPAGTPPGSAPVGSGADWRNWAAEKRELLARANSDRAALIEENKRLRAALDGRGVETESRLRAADEDRSRLASDVHLLTVGRNRAEAEVRDVYRQWEEDGRRWAGERKALVDQLEAFTAAAVNGTLPALLGLGDVPGGGGSEVVAGEGMLRAGAAAAAVKAAMLPGGAGRGE